MAVCIGAVGGDAGASLEVLRNVIMEQKEIAECLADSGIVDVEMNLSINGRYVELELEMENGTSKVIVAMEVDNVVYQEVNGRILLDKPYDIKKLNDHSKALIRRHTIKECFEFAKNCPCKRPGTYAMGLFLMRISAPYLNPSMEKAVAYRAKIRRKN